MQLGRHVWQAELFTSTHVGTQIANDMSISKEAAKQGFIVVPTNHKDAPRKLQVLDVAWKWCMARGTVYVSPLLEYRCASPWGLASVVPAMELKHESPALHFHLCILSQSIR
jgi:hypothetical protein